MFKLSVLFSKKRAPRVSVLMPAYNCDAFLAESIESILNQTFDDFEFIIVNDGSTDATADVIRRYAARDTRIRFIDNAFNGGIVAALNTGMNLCRGEYIARMDADDISMPDRIATQVAFMDAHPRCGVLGSWYQIFGEYERTMTRPERVGMVDLLSGCLIGHPTAMMRRAFFDKYHLRYTPEFQFCEDYELWSRAIMQMDFYNIQAVLLRYRAHRRSITYAHEIKQLDDTARVQKRIAEYLSSRTDVQEKLIKTFCV